MVGATIATPPALPRGHGRLRGAWAATPAPAGASAPQDQGGRPAAGAVARRPAATQAPAAGPTGRPLPQQRLAAHRRREERMRRGGRQRRQRRQRRGALDGPARARILYQAGHLRRGSAARPGPELAGPGNAAGLQPLAGARARRTAIHRRRRCRCWRAGRGSPAAAIPGATAIGGTAGPASAWRMGTCGYCHARRCARSASCRCSRCLRPRRSMKQQG
jgi:hypothetical protein